MRSIAAGLARLSPLLAAVGALLAVLAIYSEPVAGPLLFTLRGPNASAVVVFAAFTAGGIWTLRRASRSAWRWGLGLGTLFAAAQLIGWSLRTQNALLAPLLTADHLVWTVVHFLGTGWMASAGLAALIQVVDARAGRVVGVLDERPGPVGRLLSALRSPRARPRRIGLAMVMGIFVLSRLPYVLTYWPGIVFFDTFRSYSYARGTRPWDSYEPVGSSVLITAFQWLGTTLGTGDAGGVALAMLTYLLAASAAFTFMLWRLAIWGVSRGLWVFGLCWLALLPIFGMYSVSVVKDVPFSIAVTVLLVCLGELSFGPPASAARRWPWVLLSLAAIVAFATRNNGIYVLALALPILLGPLWQHRRHVLAVLGVVLIAFLLYRGPLYSALRVAPGPEDEAFAVPLQQLARIADDDLDSLTEPDKQFLTRIFGGMPPDQLGAHYVPALADPMKLGARKAWFQHSTGELLAGWASLAARFPGTALAATLANTVGYWDPDAPPYDGPNWWSDNNVRDIHLDIPSGRPASGPAAAVLASGLVPTRDYRNGVHDDGYRAIPLLGSAMSPAPVCWAWLISAALVARRRRPRSLALFVPAGILLLTCLAGPVSGGQRYTLPLFMGLPLAVSAVALSVRSSGRSPRRAALPAPGAIDLTGRAGSGRRLGVPSDPLDAAERGSVEQPAARRSAPAP
ncbi:DUF6020 family protein [Microlunatus ginsengisoli]|uniref:DUF6020 family protein n=1 Tax=Microlunatus ginsengisoli TaxID=363863 RepID=UPI0031D6DDA6